MPGERLKGHCPMGCGETLFVGGGGYITCSLIGCPKPGAVSQLLGDWETEHIVVVGEEGFSIQHPLRERLDGELFDCGLHEHMRSLPGPPAQPGRYRARRADETWSFGVLAS